MEVGVEDKPSPETGALNQWDQRKLKYLGAHSDGHPWRLAAWQ
jgi:hypothetical protein